MSVTAAVKKDSTGYPVIEKTARFLRVWITLTFANTVNYATGGDPLDLSALFSALSGFNLPTSQLPFEVFIFSQKAGQTNLFIYNWVPGTTLANGKLQVFTGAAAQTALTELSAGAYPAGVLADVVLAEILFPIL